MDDFGNAMMWHRLSGVESVPHSIAVYGGVEDCWFEFASIKGNSVQFFDDVEV